MIVDDDAHIRELVGLFLKREGFDILEASDGVEALEKLEEIKVDLVIVDIMMPKMDGWDTLREIVRRGLQQNVNIFIITAIGTVHHEKIHGLESYIRDYIPKPFNSKELIQNVKQFG